MARAAEHIGVLRFGPLFSRFGNNAQLTALVSYTPGDDLSGAAFSRASAASYFDVNGVLTQAGSGVVRDAHYIAGLRTTLLEATATNTALWSNDFSQRTAWTLAGGSNGVGPGFSGNPAGPDGVFGSTSGLILNACTTLGTSVSYIQQAPAGQPTAAQTLSTWAKGHLGGEHMWLMSTADNSTYQRTAGVLTTSKFQRLSCTSGSLGGYNFRFGIDLRDSSQTVVSATTIDYLYGAQIEAGTVATSFIPTTTVAATRAADVLTIPWSATPVALSMYVKMIDQGITAQAASSDRVIASIGNGENRLTLLATSTGYALNYRVASTDHIVTDTASLAAFGDTIEFHITLTGAGVASISHTKNGGTETTPQSTSAIAFPAAWDSPNIELGSLGGAQQGGLALAALVIVGGVTTLLKTRSASRKAIASADTTPASIVMSPNTINLVVGGADTNVTSTVTNQSGGALSSAVTYTSDTPSVFTVGASTGVVHAVAQGVGVLTATVNGLTDTTAVSVQADTTPNAVTIAPTSAAITVGGADVTFVPTVTNLAGAVLPGAAVNWTSTAPGVATVSASGLCHAVSVGSATITAATTNGKTATAAVSVSANTVPNAVTVSPTTLSLTVGTNTGTLTATVTNSQGAVLSGAVVTWSSSPTSVATVDSTGLVTPVSAGSATITATTTNSHTATCAVTVVTPVATPTSIVMSPASLAIAVGGSDVTMTSVVSGASGVIPGAPVSYTSSSPSVATVNVTTGVVHAVAAGTTTITGTTSNGLTDTSACTISLIGGRNLIYPHARFRAIERWTTSTDTATANAFFSDIDGGSLTTHPNAISVQHYGLLTTSESNGENDFNGATWATPQDSPMVLFLKYADNYAAANGQNVEDYWLHCLAGQANCVSGIYNISAAGAISFYYLLPGGGPVSSYPFTVGQTVTLSGLTAGNGSYTVSSLQKFGITLNGWTAGALGPAGVNGHTKIGNVQTFGDGTLTKANRVQTFGWASWFLVCSFATAGARAMHAQRLADNAGDTNGVLIDNMASGANYNSLTVSQEYGVQQFDTNTPPQPKAAPQWLTDISNTLTGILAQPGGPKYLRINTASYTFTPDTTLARAAKGVHDESSLTLIPYDQTELNWVIARVNEGIDVEYSNGAVYTITNGVAAMTGFPGSYNAGNYASISDRGRMSIYAEYLMAVDATFTAADGSTQKHCIMDFTNGFSVGQGPLSALILPAYRVNIGQPTGAMTQLQRTDPAGQSIRTLTRTFSLDGGATASAFVVYNHNVNGQTNYGDTSLVSTTLPTPPAGKQWVMLQADGTLGSTPLTAITSRRAEGIIVVAVTAGVLASRSDAFVAQIGVNTRVLSEPYLSGRDTLFIPALATLGVRNYRDTTVGTNATGTTNMATVSRTTGAKLNLVTQPGAASYSDTSAVDFVTAGIDPTTLSRLEGPDEVNNTTYYGSTASAQVVNVTTWMNALKTYRDGHPSATVRALPIATPSVVTTATIPAVSWAAESTFGVAHPYPGTVAPGAPLSSAISAVASIWGGVGNLPVLATATGYDTSLGISTTAHGKYIPRLVAEYYRQGIAGTFLFELMDAGATTFGLVAADGTVKPGYTSLKNMIAILGESTWTPPATSAAGLKLSGGFYGLDSAASGTVDATMVASGSFDGIDSAKSPGLALASNANTVFGFDSTVGSFSALTPITPGRLVYTLTPAGGVTTIHDLLLQKSDGTFWLLLWNEVESFDVTTGDITNAAVSTSVAFTATRTVTKYTPSTGTTGTFVSTASAATVNVLDEIIILKIV